jgi:hypothetical protein
MIEDHASNGLFLLKLCSSVWFTVKQRFTVTCMIDDYTVNTFLVKSVQMHDSLQPRTLKLIMKLKITTGNQ